MGFTQYFEFKKPVVGQAKKTELVYQKAIKECAKIVRYYSTEFGGLSGYSAHCEPREYGGIKFNGSARVGGCEDFVLREHYSENIIDGNGFQFCKTAQLPYDQVVTACLIVLSHRLGGLVKVSSDGRAEDWNAGLVLAKHVLGLKSLRIPSSINRNEKTDA